MFAAVSLPSARSRRVIAALMVWLAAGATFAQPDGASTAMLPESVAIALRQAAIPPTASAIVVLPLSGSGLSVAVNDAVPMNPASTMKLVTTYTALGMLGPAYTWRTEAFATGALRRDVLDGDLVIRGSGDPRLVIEHLWLLVNRIRGSGVRVIRGNVVLDKSAFEPLVHDPALFDGEANRPYNAGPDALLLNFKALTLGFVPDPDARTVRVVATPALVGLKLQGSIRGIDGHCGDWRARLQPDFADPMAPVFRGAYPMACGEKTWAISVLGHTQYFGAAFRALWESAGGVWKASVREGAVPPDARRIALHESAALAEVIRDINKFSNNVMTRQLYLTMGAVASGQPGNPERAGRAVRTWLASKGLDMPELVLENGAGLSRVERISAGNMARLLAHAYAAPVMPEFMSSLPLAGVDGTMQRRNGAAGSAHVKSGMLADVRAIAGYVLAASGRRYAVVAIINHPNARDGQGVHDALLQWVYQNG